VTAVADLIPLSAPEAWREALDGLPHAFGHSWESCQAMSLTSGDPTFLYVFEAAGTRVVCPFSERRWEGRTDIYTPYGFSGFTGTGPCPALPAAWRAFARERGYVCGYIGINPLLFHPSYGEPDDLFSHNSIFTLDLTRSEADLFAALSKGRRQAVRAAARDGWQPLEDRARLGAFLRRHFVDFVRSRRASRSYEFADATLDRLCRLENVLLLGAGSDGRVEAVSVFAHTPDAAEYLFNCSLPEGQHHSALLLWQGALRMKAMGVPVLNLGGGIREGDGVAAFKARFGGREVPLGALKQVYDPAAFERLCRAAGQDPARRDGFFPPYRSPGAAPDHALATLSMS
jgi:hypothetical protein